MLLGRGGLLRRRLLGASAPAAASGAARGEATGGGGVDSPREVSPRVAGSVALRDLGVFRWRSVIELSERISNDSSDDSSGLSVWLVTP